MAPPKKYATDEERKAARRAVNKAYYDRNKGNPEFMEKFNKANLAWYNARKDDPAFKEKLRLKAQERYERDKNKPEFKKAVSEKYRRGAEARMWDGIVRGAIKRAVACGIHYDNDLLEWAPTVWTGRCAISGIEFRRGNGCGPSPYSPSIDRIIPALGYTKGNCRFILHALNALKGSGGDEDALAIAKAFVAFSQRDRS